MDRTFSRAAPPKVSQLRIVGDICEGSKVVISAIISGGVESASRVQWFKTKVRDEFLDDTNLEAISTLKISKVWSAKLDINIHRLWFSASAVLFSP